MEGKSPNMSLMQQQPSLHNYGGDERQYYQETLKEMKQMIQDRVKGVSGAGESTSMAFGSKRSTDTKHKGGSMLPAI